MELSPKYLLSAVRPMYYMFKIFGLAPNTIQASGPKPSKLTSMKSYFGFACTTILIVMIIAFFIEMLLALTILKPSKGGSSIKPVPIFVVFFVVLNSIIYLILMIKNRCDKLVDVINMVVDVDGILKISGDSYRCIRRTLVLEILLFLAVSIPNAFYHCCLWDQQWYTRFSIVIGYHLPLGINTLVDLLAMNLMLLVRSRFKYLNYEFEKYLLDNGVSRHPKDKVKRKHTNENSHPMKSRTGYCLPKLPSNKVSPVIGYANTIPPIKGLRLLELRIIYDKLLDTVESINTAFGCQILMNMGVRSFIIVTSSYKLINNLKIYSETQESIIIKILPPTIYSIFLSVARISCVTLGSSAATDEAQRSVTLLQKMSVVDNLGPEAGHEIQLFLLQVLNRPLTFSAGGFFNLNRGTLSSIFGAVVTYLVIIVQMRSN